MQAKIIFRCTPFMFAILLTGCQFKSTRIQTDEPREFVLKDDSKTNESDTFKPATIEPEPTKPEPIELEPIELEPIEPESIESEPIEPEPIKPKPIKPKPIKPETEKPEPTQPEIEKPVAVMKLAGQISLDQSKLKRKNAKIENTIVYFEPLNTHFSKLPTTNAVISTQNKQFVPSVLAVTAGSQISFPNMDRILHNVFSVSLESEFDLGLYSAGTSKSITFKESGVIYVHCNVHHSMQADILVLDTPYFTQVDAAGNFELNDLPELVGTLKTWHPRGNVESRNIESQKLTENINNQNIKQTVVITRPKVPKHRNKFGNSYRRTRY